MESENKTRGNAKSIKWLLVINSKQKADQSAIISDLEGFQDLLLNYNVFKYVFTIIHDQDPVKVTHCHAFLELYEKLSKSELLKELSELLKVDKEQLSLEATNSDFLGVQYLTHKNQPNKEPYPFESIKTNNQEALLNRYEMVYTDKEEEVKNALYSSETMTDLLTKISLQDAKKYQSIWKDIIAEKKNDVKALYKTIEEKQRQLEDLYHLASLLIDTCENGLNIEEKRLISLNAFRLQLIEFEDIIFKN